MRELMGKRYATRAKTTAAEMRAERTRFANAFGRIRKAAHDGQNSSATHALDRLALIERLATTMLPVA